MRIFRLWVPVSALALVISVAGSAWPQSTTESETTVTTVPTVTSKTVTKKTVMNTPTAIVVNPPSPAVATDPPPSSSEIALASTTSDYSAPTEGRNPQMHAGHGTPSATSSTTTTTRDHEHFDTNFLIRILDRRRGLWLSRVTILRGAGAQVC